MPRTAPSRPAARKPARPAARAGGLDPVTLEILWTRLIAMVDEAAATFVRTSFSTLVREANDYAVVLTDAEGRSLAQNAVSIPSFIGTLPATVKHFLARHPAHTLKPGDVLITNDPWMGTGHIHDINIAAPIFHRGRLVAFAAVTSHMPDIGGQLRNAGIREVFEEGLQIPILKLIEAGKVNPVLPAIIAENVRVPEQTMGDVWAEVAACRMLEERLIALLDETGIDLGALGSEIRGRSERAMRAAIATVPSGTYNYVVLHDGFEERIRLDCTLTVEGDRIAIDYAGSSPQLPRAVNVVPIYAFAYSAFPLKALLCPDVPNNEGAFLPISTSAPAGTILNPRFPAASGARGMIGHMLTPAIMGALSQAIPDRVQAPGSANSSVTMTGEHKGRRFAVVNFLNAGQGASARREGLSVISFPSNLGNTPIEVMESLAPIRVTHRSIRKQSGGRGRKRGGAGLSFGFDVASDSPVLASFIMTRVKVPPPGLLGGQDGAPARLTVNDEPIDHARHHVLKPGDRVLMETAGGGGYGAPEEQPAAS